MASRAGGKKPCRLLQAQRLLCGAAGPDFCASCGNPIRGAVQPAFSSYFRATSRHTLSHFDRHPQPVSTCPLYTVAFRKPDSNLSHTIEICMPDTRTVLPSCRTNCPSRLCLCRVCAQTVAFLNHSWHGCFCTRPWPLDIWIASLRQVPEAVSSIWELDAPASSALRQRLLSNDLEALIAQRIQRKNPLGFDDILPRLPVPCLLMVGEADTAYVPDSRRYLHLFIQTLATPAPC